MRSHRLLLAVAGVCSAHEKVFSVNEDFLAFPQYDIVFSDSYVLDTEAQSSLSLASSYSTARPKETETLQIKASKSSVPADSSTAQQSHNAEESNRPPPVEESYERMILNSAPYLCSLPLPIKTQNTTDTLRNKEEETKELIRATDRGWELLKELEGQCLYFTSGWWSYSFCHNRQVKQFHALPRGPGGSGHYALVEDDSVPSFILGQYPNSKVNKANKANKAGDTSSQKTNQPASEVGKLETRGDMRYMVQKLYHGQICDITGRPRSVEIQFHCADHTSDHIGFIKEVSTCAYLMVIHTPRLCNDIAFQPPEASEAQQIVCKEILKESEVDSWQAKRSAEIRQSLDSKTLVKEKLMDRPAPQLVIGGIEVGGMKEVGGEGRRIDTFKAIAPGNQAGEAVVRWHPDENGGKIQQMTEERLQDLELSGKLVRKMREELEKVADGKPYELRVVERGNGVRELQGMVEDEDDFWEVDEHNHHDHDYHDHDYHDHDYHDHDYHDHGHDHGHDHNHHDHDHDHDHHDHHHDDTPPGDGTGSEETYKVGYRDEL